MRKAFKPKSSCKRRLIVARLGVRPGGNCVTIHGVDDTENTFKNSLWMKITQSNTMNLFIAHGFSSEVIFDFYVQ